MEDQDTGDYIELPISQNPYDHEWLMYCAKSLEVEIVIKGGVYKVFYSNPMALYELGKLQSIKPTKEDFKCNYGLLPDGKSFNNKLK